MVTTVKIYGFGLSDGTSGSKRDYVELDIDAEISDDIDEETVKDTIYGTLRSCGVRGMLRDQRVTADKIRIGYQRRDQTTLSNFDRKMKKILPEPQLAKAAQYVPLKVKNPKTGRMVNDKARRYINPKTGRIISRRQHMAYRGIVPEVPAQTRRRIREQEEEAPPGDSLSDLADKIRASVSSGGFKSPKTRTRQNKSDKIKSEYKQEYEQL